MLVVLVMIPMDASGGSLSVVTSLSTELASLGITIHTAYRGRNTIRIGDQLINGGLGKQMHEIRKFIKANGVAIIHTHLSTYWVGAVAARLVGITSIRTLHGSIMRPGMRTVRERMLMYLSAVILNQQLVTVAERVTSEVEEVYPTLKARGKIHEIPNGVMISGLRNTESPTDGIVTLIYSGRLETAKGFHHLIHAFKRLYRESPKLHLIVAGDGPLRDTVDPELMSEGVVTLTDGWISQDEVKSLLLRSQVFVLPSLSEGLSISLMEAMQIGVVPVVSKCCVSNEVIVDGVEGIIVDTDSEESLYQGLRRVLDGTVDLESMRQASIRKISSSFSSRTMALRYAELYKELVARVDA